MIGHELASQGLLAQTIAAAQHSPNGSRPANRAARVRAVRPCVDDFSLDRLVSDLEAVVDAEGLGRFALLGISQGGAVSIVYAARHPERVGHTVSALMIVG